LRAPFVPDGLRLRTPLAGRYQAENVATALTMLDAAGPPWRPAWDDVPGLLAGTRLAGRLHRAGRYLFDVAHNPDGARALVAALPALSLPRPLTALVGVLSDKDWRGILDAVGPAADRLVLTTAPSAPPGRVWSPEAAAAYARDRGWAAEAAGDFDAALAGAAMGEGTVLVTGSFHTVGDAMVRLQVSLLAA
jgi:dihydrofolate synthase/folylpolyglutamate synthase